MKEKKLKITKKIIGFTLAIVLVMQIAPLNLFAQTQEGSSPTDPAGMIEPVSSEPSENPEVTQPEITPEETPVVTPETQTPFAPQQSMFQGITPASASDLKVTLWDGATQVADLSDPNNDYNWGFDKTLTLKFTADFPNDTDADKKININISDDFKYVSYPTMASMPTEVKDAITSVTRSNQTKILGNTITLDNGDLAYTVAAGYTKVSLEIQIAHNKVVEESNPSQASINPITVTETYGGSVQATQILEKATISKTVVQTFVASASGNIVLNQAYRHQVYLGDNIAGTGSAQTANAYTESLIYEIEYPEGVVPENLGVYAVDDPINRKVIFTITDKQLVYTSLGIILNVDFKLVDDTLPVDTILNYTAKASVKKYKEPLKEYTKAYTQKVVAPTENFKLGEKKPNVKNDTFGNPLTQPLSQFLLQNNGNINTPNKKLSYTFDNPNIGVTAVDVPIAAQETKTIRYKMVGEDTYKTYTGVIPYATGSDANSTSPRVRVSNTLLGETGGYFSELVIEDAGAYTPGYSIGNSSDLYGNAFAIGKFLTDEQGAYSFGTVTVSNLDNTDPKTAILGGTVTGGKRNSDITSPVFNNKGVMAGNEVTMTGQLSTTTNTSVTSTLSHSLELYVYEKNGITFNDATIKAMDTNTIVPYVLSTVKTLGDGTVIKKLKLDENAYIGSWNEKHNLKGLSLSFTFNTKNTMITQPINMNEYVFVGVNYPEGNTMTTHPLQGKLMTDTEDLNGNGIEDQIIGLGGVLSVTAQKDIVLSNAIKLSNETEWYTFSSGGKVAAFNAGSTADYKFEAKNASGQSVEAFEYYIPVPKKGQNFGTDFQPEAFTWDMALTAGITVPAGYEVAYSKTATGINFKDGATFTTNTGSWTDADWKSVNMIRIKNTSPILDGTDVSFPMQFLINETPENAELLSGSINKFSTYGYRDFTVVKGWAQGQTVAAQLVTGKVAGVAFVDKNKNGIQDAGDTVLPNTTLKITKSDGSAVTGLNPGDTVTTDVNGKYEIKGMSPGNYKLTVTNPGSPDSSSTNPVKYKFTTKNVGTDITIDSDVTPAADQLTGTVNLTVPSTTLDTIGIGFIEPYKVTYETGANGTIGSPASITRWPGETIGTAIPTTTPATNYRLEGWVKDTDPNAQTVAAVQAFAVNQDLKFTARFIGVDQTVTFDSQGGIFTNEAGTPATISKVTPFDKTFTFPSAPTKSHYVFAGWYKDAGCTAGQEAVASTYKTPLGGATLYAKWIPKALQPEFNFVQTSPMAKTYGDANFTVNAGGGAGTGAVTYELVSGPGTINATTGAVTITGAGPIVVKATKAEDATNDTAEATLTINVAKASLTATTTDQTSVYGETLPALPSVTVTGFVLGETAGTAAGYTAPAVSYATTPGTPANVGTYGYTISGGLATNYSFNYDTTKALTVTKAVQPELTFTDASVTKTYGDADFTNALSGGAGTGAVTYSSSDTAKATVDSAGKVSLKGAGTVTITATKASDANYSNTVTKTYTLTINKKDLTVTADNKTKTYLEANPALTLGYTGFATGDDVSKLTGTKPTASTTAVASSPVGTYPITVTVTGAADANYNFVKGPDATLTVTAGTQPDLSFASTSVTKTYGDTAFTNAISGGAGTGALTFESSNPAVAEIDAATGLVTIKGAGNATITATKLGDANYSNTVNKTYTLTVDKKELTATPDSKVKVYGETNETLTISYTGFVNGEDAANLTGTLPVITTTATDTSNAGTYPITVDVDSATDANYTFVKGTDATYTIAKKNQDAIAFEDATVEKTYGDTTFEDALTSVGSGTGALTYTSSDESKATVDQDGKVTIKGSGEVTITAKKVADGNYTSDVTASFALTINKATLKATASNETMVAGQSLPAGSVEVTGFKYADTASSAKGYEGPKVAYTTNGATAGTYTINANGGKADDYTFTYTAGTLTVNPAPVPPVDPVTPKDKTIKRTMNIVGSATKEGSLEGNNKSESTGEKDKETANKKSTVSQDKNEKTAKDISKKEENSKNYLFYILGALALILLISTLIYFILKRRKKEEEQK